MPANRRHNRGGRSNGNSPQGGQGGYRPPSSHGNDNRGYSGNDGRTHAMGTRSISRSSEPLERPERQKGSRADEQASVQSRSAQSQSAEQSDDSRGQSVPEPRPQGQQTQIIYPDPASRNNSRDATPDSQVTRAAGGGTQTLGSAESEGTVLINWAVIDDIKQQLGGPLHGSVLQFKINPPLIAVSRVSVQTKSPRSSRNR